MVTLDPKVEQEIMGSVKQTEQGAYLTLDPEKTKNIMESLKQEVAKLENIGKNPIVITSPIVRMYFKKLTEDYFRRLCYNVGVSQRLRAGIYRRYPKAVVLECMKWAATLLLSLTMSPRKSLWLIRMRYEISRGLFSRAGH